MKLMRHLSCALLACCVLLGCESHIVQPRGADMATFGYKERRQTDSDIQTKLDLVPLARFPASLAVVRVQSAADTSRSHGVSYGRGAYRVILTPTVETQNHFNKIGQLDQLSGVVRLNRLLVSERLSSDKQLRTAAARLHADLLLVYTINTQWTIDEDAKPLTKITFGLSRYKNVRVTSTATALLVGTHNGYVYATTEVMRDKKYKDNAWRNAEQIEEAQEGLEQEAFDGLVDSFAKAWPGVVRAYAEGKAAQR